MLNGKIKIQKKYDGKTPGIIIFGKIKHKKLYTKINVIVKENKSTNYKISISKNYEDFNLKENDVYYVNYKLLNKCSNELWNKKLNKHKSSLDEIIDNNNYINEDE